MTFSRNTKFRENDFFFAKLRNSFRFRFAKISRNEIPLKTLIPHPTRDPSPDTPSTPTPSSHINLTHIPTTPLTRPPPLRHTQPYPPILHTHPHTSHPIHPHQALPHKPVPHNHPNPMHTPNLHNLPHIAIDTPIPYTPTPKPIRHPPPPPTYPHSPHPTPFTHLAKQYFARKSLQNLAKIVVLQGKFRSSQNCE
jgi:hypothetical protein